jgi:competence protein ComFC
MSFLDFIFPKRCVNCRRIGAYICPDCFVYIQFNEAGTCVVCQRASFDGLTHPVCKGKYNPDGVFSSLVYKGVVKKLIYKFKYNPHLTDLKSVMEDFFYEGLIQKEQFYKLLVTKSVLVPIPLHKTRARKRGYNQSLILAKGLGRRLNIEVLDCLERVRDTKTQVGLKKEEREGNIKDAFRIKKNVILSKAKDLDSSDSPQNDKAGQVFLIDDVVTSGATLKEAAKVLKKAGVGKVYAITLAHGQ